MTAASCLTVADAFRIVREEEANAKDKSYRQFPIGQMVGSFLRAKRVERGVTPNTIRSYETVLRLFTLRFADFEDLERFAHPQEGPELVHDFLEHYWGEAEPATRWQRRAVLDSFFEWAYRTDRVASNPMGRMQRPRRRGRGARRKPVPSPHLARLVSAAPSLRDQAALLLLGRLALRREDLRLLQLGDIDLGRDEVYLRHGKGGREAVLPIAFPDLKQALYLHLQERPNAPGEFLLYPKQHRTRPLSRAGIDGWFGRRVEAAGLVGYTMHQLRHTAIDHVRRITADSEMARIVARHSDSRVTQEYLHTDEVNELREAIRRSV